MHVHASALDFIVVAAFVLILGLALRMASARLAQSDTPLARSIGEGLSFIY